MPLILSKSCFLWQQAAHGACASDHRGRLELYRWSTETNAAARQGCAMSQSWHRCRRDIMSQGEGSSLHPPGLPLQIPPPAARRSKPIKAFDSRRQSELRPSTLPRRDACRSPHTSCLVLWASPLSAHSPTSPVLLCSPLSSSFVAPSCRRHLPASPPPPPLTAPLLPLRVAVSSVCGSSASSPDGAADPTDPSDRICGQNAGEQ